MIFTVERVEKYLQEIEPTIARETRPIPQFRYFEGEAPGAQCAEFDDRNWSDFQVGDSWGGYDKIAWFRAWVPIPPGWNRKKLALRFLVGPRDGGGSTAETLLYVNGAPLQGIDVWHEQAWLPPEVLQGERFFIALKAWSGVLHVPERRHFKLAQLFWIDENAECFYFLVDTLVKAVKTLDANDLRRQKLVNLLNETFRCVDFLKPRSEEYYRSLGEAHGFLQAALKGMETHEIKPKVTAIGHSHIDVAWLWRVAHSREKTARTFSTVLHLMRQYPEYRFMHSTPALYKFLKEDYPDIYRRVKEKILSGQWEITGGMWVEADTNIPNGEALVRQLLLGKRFIKDEFGQETKILWLPDVFGYSAALPQLVLKSGMKYFLTTKISWNEFNRFPYDTFHWRGLDGQEMLTHFVTTPDPGAWFYTYNGKLDPAEVKGLWDNYRQKDINAELLSLFGWGDGGGGPTREMLESARGLRNLPGLPEVEMGKAEPYFARLEERLRGVDLPVWDGELYLEYHRGTYTSQAKNKRLNRLSEVLYHNAEWLCALEDILTGSKAYPSQALQEGWEKILLNQFHDVLPGSSIHPVYEDSYRDYETIAQFGEQALDQARQSLLRRIAVETESLVVFNPLSMERDDLLCLPWSEDLAGKTVLDANGNPAPVQEVSEPGGKKILLEVCDSPALGYSTYPLADETGQQVQSELAATPTFLENWYYRLELNNQGQITSLWDKRNHRQVLAPGKRGNVLQAFEDKPLSADAWNVDIFYQEKMREVSELQSVVVEETGPVRATLRLVWRFGDSTVTQRLSLYRSLPRIDFRTEVDWHEHQVLLKVAFPVAVRATRATYDIQFGNLERPTHWNTSWDYARFETCAQKWADLSEGDYGVALLNDCKYGHDIKDNLIRLTLIKSGIEPDPQADQGQHVFTYSLLPHAGDWRQGDVVRQAYQLNYPLLAGRIAKAQAGDLPGSFQFVTLEAENVVIETVKRAEDDRAWVIRLYEYQQCHSNGLKLRFGLPIQKAAECNLMEEDDQPITFTGDTLEFSIAPYEIKTFKVWL